MADQTLASLTAATPATGGLFYGTQGGADRKFTLSAHGAALVEGTGLVALLAAPNIFTAAGAASTPGMTLNGSIFTGGTSTSTKPLFLIEPAGTTSNGWSTNGTMLGVNAPSGFSGDVLRACLNGSTAAFRVYLDSSGTAFFGPPYAGCVWYGGKFYPESVDGLALGRPGVSLWNGCHLTSAAQVDWNGDAGLTRSGTAALKVTNGSSGYGTIDASGYFVSGAPGVDGTFTTTDGKTVTVSKGIITTIV